MRSAAACAASLILLLVCAPAGAEPDETGLDALLARMAATRGVAAEFRESREVALLVEPLESRGLLYFVPPDRMARFTTAFGMASTSLLRAATQSCGSLQSVSAASSPKKPEEKEARVRQVGPYIGPYVGPHIGPYIGPYIGLSRALYRPI